jgi:hypothetical protein
MQVIDLAAAKRGLRASMKRLANAMFSCADIDVLLLANSRFSPTGRQHP